MTNADAERAQAVRSVFWSATLSGLGQLAFLVIEFRLVGATPLAWEQGAHALIAAGVLTLLALRRRTASVRLCHALLLATALPFLVTMWTGERQRVAWGLRFTPFVGEKLVVFGLALLAPSVWIGAGLIAAIGAEVVVIAGIPNFDALPSATGEPWIMFVYCAVAIVLLVHRLRHLQLEREIARVRAEARASEQLARTFAAVRDLANTPLQTIAINLALRERRPGAPEPARRIANALTRLRELDGLLHAAEQCGGRAAFDSRRVLLGQR